MQGTTQFRTGDRVIHAERPEWGPGQVVSTSADVHDGRPCQRLQVRFDRGGLKTLSTAFAPLHPADAENGQTLDNSELVRMLTSVPEGATDPFRTRRDRMATTLGLYRFSASGSSLLDWASMQTGLSDPLTRFSRHELETHFHRFARSLDEHLKKLAYELSKEDPGAIDQLAASAPSEGRAALRRVAGRR